MALASRQLMAMPCDTGGVWHGKVVAEPAFTNDSDKRAYLEGEARSVVELSGGMQNWLEDGYATWSDYVEGMAPTKHLSRIVLDETVNSAHAWTWEVRLQVEMADRKRITPLELFWSEAEFEEFESWAITSSGLPPAECVDLVTKARKLSKFTDRPIQALTTRLYELI